MWASLEHGRACRDYLHNLLALEFDIPGSPGALAHFFAVASCNRQHPVRDVCAVDLADYVDRVREWASSVEQTLRTSSKQA